MMGEKGDGRWEEEGGKEGGRDRDRDRDRDREMVSK